MSSRVTPPPWKVNRISLEILTYKGGKTTLCAGAGKDTAASAPYSGLQLLQPREDVERPGARLNSTKFFVHKGFHPLGKPFAVFRNEE